MALQVIKQPLFQSVAEGIYNEILSRIGRYHFFLGKTLEWESDDTPEDVQNDYIYELETRNRIITTKQIGISDVSYVIPRINWKADTVYDMYDDIVDLSTKNYYVVTPSNLVYKCISNNYGAKSTVEPTTTSTDLIYTGDGYIWKFMYIIPDALENKFMSIEYMPVLNSLRSQFYSNGSIVGFTIDDPGSGYTTATLDVSGDGYLEQNPYIINDVTVDDPGKGYVDTVSPSVTISAPEADVDSGGEIQATATAVMSVESGSEDTIASVTLDETGYGYTKDATVTIEDPISYDALWVSEATVNTGDIIKHDNVFYEISFVESGVSSGDLGTTAPSHEEGTATNGDAELEVVAKTAILSLDLKKTEADLEAVIDDGKITNVIINDGGVSYSFANIVVTGDGEGAVITTDLSIGDINTLQSNVELFAVDGSIDYIKVTNQGSGYTEATVTIDGDGENATAQPIIEDGKITSIEIINRGTNYKTATISISGDGSDATARAILSPPGGHGFDALSELGAKSLMFYTNVSQEKNQTFDVNNDYRQLGIVKSLKNFNDNADYKKLIGSACYRVYGDINPDTFVADTEVTNQNDKRFIIITSRSGEALMQTIDNQPPAVGNIISDDSENSFVVSKINKPTVDKFSGNILFIENRENFVPSLNQSITIKTVINI